VQREVEDRFTDKDTARCLLFSGARGGISNTYAMPFDHG
jgi:hypothetical protein